MQNEASFTSNADTKSQHYFGNDAGYNRVALSLSPYSESRFVVKHQDLINRHAICLTRLREAAREVESLLEENATLRSVNRELNDQLSFMINASVQKSFSSSEYDTTPFEIVNRFQSMSCAGGGGSSGGGGEEFCEDESPTSVIETGSNDVERNWLPKSISVRSNGYLKLSQVGAPSKTRTATRPRISSSLNAAQKVYVRGGKKEEEPLELEVYNQGMFKTEICNKWQETGACPYGDHCQFAHGIEELRPVIRHPRYKTEVCRMILAGDICPYGHRCHFRHALSEQEKLMGNLRPPTTLTLDR